MSLRSSLGTLMQFFLVAGFLLEYIVGPYTSYLTLVIVSLATPILCFGMFVWMPDSPQSLLIRPGGEQKAMESLRWLRGNPQETALIKELEEIKVRICTHGHYPFVILYDAYRYLLSPDTQFGVFFFKERVLNSQNHPYYSLGTKT